MLNEIIVDVFAGGGGASSGILVRLCSNLIGGYIMNLEGKIVFISGAITGIDGYRKIFAAAERWLLEQDCTVLNPAVLPPTGMTWDAYLRITKAMLREADVVYVLQNWEHSRGVKEELDLAARLGKEIIYEPREAVIV